MAEAESNISVQYPKDVSNIHDSSEVQSKASDESGVLKQSVVSANNSNVPDNMAKGEDSGTLTDSSSSTSEEDSEDSVAASDKSAYQTMEGSLFTFGSKEWLQSYSKRLPEILSKIAEPHLYKNNKCKFVNVEAPYTSFEPETVCVKMKSESGKFQIKLDTSLFILKSINVQVFEGKINVAAYHQMEGPFGHEAHEMQQIFPLPEFVDRETITAELTSKGTLIIEGRLNEALKKPPFVPKKNKIIPICESKSSD